MNVTPPRSHARVRKRHYSDWGIVPREKRRNSQSSISLVQTIRTSSIQDIEKTLEEADHKNISSHLLFDAIETGRLGVVQLLLDHNVDINTTNRKGTTPLMRAINLRLTDIALLLLKYGADIEKENKIGQSVLILAVAFSCSSFLVKQILEHNPEINKKTTSGVNALLIATSQRNLEVMRLLLESGADPHQKDNSGNSAVSLVSNDSSLLQFLLSIFQWNKNKLLNPPQLVAAVLSSDVKLVNMLIKSNIDVNEKCQFQGSPLFVAVVKNYVEIAEILLSSDASIEKAEFNDKSCLVYAAQRGHSDMISLLLKYGAPVDDRSDQNEFTPLMNASINGETAAMRLLFEAGADVTAIDKDGNNALHWATDPAAVELLINFGCPIEAKNKFNATPFTNAVERKNKEVMSILLLNGAEPKICCEKCGNYNQD